MKFTSYSLILSFFIALSGCATIVGESTQTLPIMSSPDGASIVITDEKGAEIFKGTTPTTVTLEKSDGSYWGGKSFNLVLSKDGYDTVEIPVKTSANGWYIGGNILFGGLIGWFIVDPLNGNMYTLSAKEINTTLSKSASANATKFNENISIVMLDEVPEELRSKLVKVSK